MSAVSSQAPPRVFWEALGVYHLFPLHAPLTLFVLDAPFGRFASATSRFSFNGNISWFIMEVVAPIALLTTLYSVSVTLTFKSTVLAALYILHYAHRAVLSPLVLSPPRSKSSIIIPLLAGGFNVLNAYCLAVGLAYFPPLESAPFWPFIAGWAISLSGNIYHDEILNDLRRPAGSRLVSSPKKEDLDQDRRSGNGRYAIPRGGLFEYISFPNYLCEWSEWTCFALAAAPQIFIRFPSSSILSNHLQNALKKIGWYPGHLLHPTWMFALFMVVAMLPRAQSGHRWYKATFGERYPKRKAVFPGIL